MDDVLVVVVAQAAAQLLVVHLGLVFPLAPPPSHLQTHTRGRDALVRRCRAAECFLKQSKNFSHRRALLQTHTQPSRPSLRQACALFVLSKKLRDVLFIWPSAQDLPARVAVTGGVAAPHLIWVGELEFPAVACPADEGLARLVGQQLQEKLPQLDRAAACRTEEEDEEKHF